MITIYRRSSANEMLVELKETQPGAWIDLTIPSKEEIKGISDMLRIDQDMLRGVMDEEERPRVERENGNLLIIIRVPSFDENNKIEVVPLGILITNNNVITVSPVKNCVIEDFKNMKVKNFFTTKKTRFVLQLFSRTNYHYKKYLDFVDKSIEDQEKSILKSFKNEEIVKMLNLQKELVYVNTAVISNEKALDKLLNGRMLRLYEEDKDLLEDIIIENKESIEMVNIYSNILGNTMDAYASLVSNNLNVVMKFLASFTIILAIPSIIASLYGMNVALPMQNNPYAFWITIALSVIMMAIATVVFMRKNFF